MTILINQLSLVQEIVKHDKQGASEVFVGQDFLITTLGKKCKLLLDNSHAVKKRKNKFSLNFSSS